MIIYWTFEDVGFSICMERELTWPGLWVPSRQGYLAAIWESEVDGEIVEAKMYLDNKNSLRRRDSSDRNDGEYHIDRRVPLDPLQRFDLVIGSRRLRSGRNEVRRAWHGIWWRFDIRSPATEPHLPHSNTVPRFG